ncbi:hypothetical protein [Spiroplasma endosymbiont of Sarcophaga carnaria]|uniref:hypothetical protein n=1 Tax=Spiroplasma endosymbiont of Sarcophaga carnaria TaxID=3066303 RepID=UPI0030D26BC2
MLTTAGEEEIIGAETTVSATLAPETLGLSVLIGLIIVGTTSLIWWLNDSSSQLIRNKPHSQYNEIEKYYKVFHDQLKIGINLSKWKKISQIYYQYYNNYQKFSHMVKKEIIDFYREDHSGWGGSINENDIDILIKVLFNNFNEINNKFVVNSVGGWKIVTDTNGSYFLME